MKNRYFLGIDTSNYTTSVAVTDVEGNIIADERILLSVKEGNRGLRQQEAVFQHMRNLPVLLYRLFQTVPGRELTAVTASVKPRNREGSYMPCFQAGESFGRSIAMSLGIPFYETDHQSGHLYAAKAGREIKEDFIFCHLSGGTCEYIDTATMEIAGGSLDISFGQLVDRAGVKMGDSFPCGKRIDERALKRKGDIKLPKIQSKDGWFNLSGIETKVMRMIEDGIDYEEISYALFMEISRCLNTSITQVCYRLGRKNALLAGGVSSSRFLREYFASEAQEILLQFGEPGLCSDNAIGVSLIGGEQWRESQSLFHS